MTHAIRTVALAATVLLAVSAPLHAQAKGLKIGDTAPTVVIHTLDGKPADLAQYVGKTPLLIEFWATWCPLCREMEPELKKIHATHGSKLTLLRIAVPQNQTPERVTTHVAKNELPGVFLFDTDGKAYKAFAAYHTSYIVVLDRNGKVTYSADGGKQSLDAAIAAALR